MLLKAHFFLVVMVMTLVTGGRNVFDSCIAMLSIRAGGGGRETGIDVVASAENFNIAGYN